MKQPARLEAVSEYTQGEWPGYAALLELVVIWFLGALDVGCSALKRSLGFLGLRSTLSSDYRNLRVGARPRLVLKLDKAVGSLGVAISNRSHTEVWVEEATVNLVDVETDGETYTPAQAVLKIREPVAPSECLYISLIDTVYNAAGRPQGVYSFTISALLRYRTDQSDEEFQQAFPLCHAKMNTLVPIGLCRMGWFDKSARSREPESGMGLERGEQERRVRHSRRVTAQAAVVVEGRFGDGSAFSDATHAFVLSAHGCLVTLGTSIRIGEKLVLRNVATLQKQHCRVVYVGEQCGGRMKVGLGFETAAPGFWGIHRMP
jgi:hypothetical protein